MFLKKVQTPAIRDLVRLQEQVATGRLELRRRLSSLSPRHSGAAKAVSQRSALAATPTPTRASEPLADGLMTVTEAAARWGLSKTCIRRLLADGRVGGRKLGPLWVVDEGSLRLYLANQRGSRLWPEALGGSVLVPR